MAKVIPVQLPGETTSVPAIMYKGTAYVTTMTDVDTFYDAYRELRQAQEKMEHTIHKLIEPKRVASK